jgi:hypothetical protein
MNTNELRKNLNFNGIPQRWYLINEGKKSDTHILEEYNGLWKYYYFDEKGNIRNECHFRSEAEACKYIYDKLIELFKYFH